MDLIRVLNRSNLAEFKLKDGDFELSIRTDRFMETKTGRIVSALPASPAAAPFAAMPAPAPAPVAPAAETVPDTPAAPAAKTVAAKEDTSRYLEVKSPMVGTFYRSSSPEKPAFAEVGKKINKGEVICIIEAMKLFNEIDAEFGGRLIKVLAEDATPVEYDQPLFLIDPTGV